MNTRRPVSAFPMAGLLLGAALALPLVLTTVGCRTAPPGESATAAITRELTFTNEAGVVVSGRDVAYEDMALLVEAILLVKQSYVEERPFRELLYGAIDGMLVSLDPHSAFLKPESYDALQEETQGSFCGIGITIGVQNGMLTVIAPIEDSPAFRQGLHSGDRIAAVEGVTTRGMTVDQAVGRLRGARGTAVTLTIHREGAEPRDVTIVRDEIRLTSVKGARVLENGIGYVRIIQFGEKTPAEFTEALRGLRAQQIRGLVIDLRGNPGGLLESAVAVAQHFLPERATVVSIRGRAGAADERVFRAGGPDHDAALPLAVLINRGSASASEIVAGALQDHARAVIVGETSFGKASVQNVIATRTRPSCAVKLTTAHYFTPLGRLIHGKGIVPGEVVPLKQEQWRQVQLKRLYEEMPDAYPAAAREPVDQAIDTQLERALARLRPAPAGDAPKAGSSRESKETSLTNAAPAE